LLSNRQITADEKTRKRGAVALASLVAADVRFQKPMMNLRESFGGIDIFFDRSFSVSLSPGTAL
jgi:hypothetical protein